MSERIQRYKFDCPSNACGLSWTTETIECGGNWCKSEDVKKLEAERDALKAANYALKKEVENMRCEKLLLLNGTP